MVRICLVILLAALLPACATLSGWPALMSKPQTPSDHPLGHYSFSWRLSGDRAVAPLQVFDDGRKTWLQFPAQQALPAIFEHTAQGDRPLSYRREGAYVVLSGVWPRLLLRGGHLTSYVERVTDTMPVQDEARDEADRRSDSGPEHSPSVFAEASAPLVETLTASSFEKVTDVTLERYEVSPQDHNLRSTLARWARHAGWTFEPEHWAVDADIPIVGAASFESGFEPAVQELVAATELADRPLQPCFYSNRVLRVVPYAQSCDRTVGAAVTS